MGDWHHYSHFKFLQFWRRSQAQSRGKKRIPPPASSAAEVRLLQRSAARRVSSRMRTGSASTQRPAAAARRSGPPSRPRQLPAPSRPLLNSNLLPNQWFCPWWGPMMAEPCPPTPQNTWGMSKWTTHDRRKLRVSDIQRDEDVWEED